MKENRMKEVLQSIAQRNVPEDTNIWPQIAANVERKNFMRTVRARPALALLLVLLALALLSSVAYAIGKATGYIPGVGIVDQSVPLRILAEPVVVEKDGLTVSISTVVADSDRTFVAYSIDGIPVPGTTRPICGELPSLQLPDGSVLNIVNIDDGGPQGAPVGSLMTLEQSVMFSSIPANVNTVTLTLPCILPEGTGPENWQILIPLSPAPQDYATPAVEVGATFVAAKPEFTPEPMPEVTPQSSAASVPMPNGSGLYLDKVIELPNSYILVGNFTDAGDLPGGLQIDLDPYADLPHMEDGLGNPIAFKVREDIQPATTWADRFWVRNWAYEIPKSVKGPVTITLDQINIVLLDKTQFNFDVGPNPQVGQKMEFNLPIHLRSYDYVIDSVAVIENGYLFKYHSGIDVPQDSLSLNIPGYSPEQDNGRTTRQETRIEYSKGLIYSAPFPTGQLTVELTVMETTPLRGPWIVTWIPPGK
jgi:hypothetical protein